MLPIGSCDGKKNESQSSHVQFLTRGNSTVLVHYLDHTILAVAIEKMNASDVEQDGKLCKSHYPCIYELISTTAGTAQSSLDDDKSCPRLSSASTDTKSENAGDPVTRTQQCRVLASTCLMAFTIIGLNQSFGVFQAHYGRQASAMEGVLLQTELSQRPLISAIGSLGNGGIFAAFGVFYYPYLPKLGGHIRYLCGLGTAFIAIGFAAAAGSHNVSQGSQLLSRQMLTRV
jgi:hypothetical protein